MEFPDVFLNASAERGFALGVGSALAFALFLPLFSYMGKAFVDYICSKKKQDP